MNTIVEELKGEKIDIIKWSEDPAEYIAAALSPADVISVEELPDGTYQINGTLAINDLVELLGFEPEEADEVETAGGLLLKLFDRIPDEGDVAVLEHRGTKVTFTVLAMDRLRIDRICMAIDRPDEE